MDIRTEPFRSGLAVALVAAVAAPLAQAHASVSATSSKIAAHAVEETGQLRRLGDAHDLARELVARRSCQDLFAALGADGIVQLERSLYQPAPLRYEQLLCRRGVTAFTTVGSPRTFLCRSYSSLSETKAALVLIHEALHFAGLGEAPVDPQAPSSAEINQLVEESCGAPS